MSVQAPGSKGGGISGALTGRHLDVRHLVAGTGAGAVSTAALFPLDLIKTRFQVHNGHLEGDRYLRIPRYRSLGDAARRIFGTEGFRGFYQGLSPALIGASASWGLYFFFYENAKTRRQVQAGVAGEGHSKLPTSQHLLSACEAGVITTLCTNPIWLVKTRLQLQVRTVPMPDGSQMTQNYRGFWGVCSPPPAASPARQSRGPDRAMRYAVAPADALTSVVRNEGPLALYRGIVPALLLVSHGAIQFTVYEELKRRIGVAKGDQVPAPPLACLTHPCL